MKSYTDFANEARSQKITLAVLRAKQRIKKFNFVSGSTWQIKTNFYVSNLIGADYTFDPTTSILTVTSSANPNTLNLIVEYSFFFSDFPVNMEVSYEPRLVDIGGLKLELDTENIGVAIESDSNIKLENQDGFFDDKFDALIWENQLCEFYSWNRNIPWSEKKLIYKGYISTKTFSPQYVQFNLKDTFVKLREKLPDQGTRLIYGRVKGLDCTSLDLMGDGVYLTSNVSGRNDRDALTGIFSGTAGLSQINGTGTIFTTELNVSDKVRIIDGVNEYSYTVDTILSNTAFKISGTIDTTFAGATAKNASKSNNIITGSGFLDEVSPGDDLTIAGVTYSVESVTDNYNLIIQDQIETAFISVPALNKHAINYRLKNRNWSVSGHRLADHATSIETVFSSRVFSVVDIGHIKTNDTIQVDGLYYTASRVSGKKIFLNQDLLTTIVSGDNVIKPAIQSVKFDDYNFVPGRDYFEVNSETGCEIFFDTMAEMYATEQQITGVALSFVNGSRVVTAISTELDLTKIFQPRSFIKPNMGTTAWYEVLDVNETEVILRHQYSQTKFTGPALYKTPNYLGDDSKVLIETMGKKNEDGTWLKTASHAVKDICQQIGIDNLNIDSFNEAESNGDFTLALVYPKAIGGDLPDARSAILEINKSVFGSLFINNDFEVCFSVLNADRDEEIKIYDDVDILSFTTVTKNQIVGSVISNYCHQFGSDTYSTYTFENDNIPEINTSLSLELYLFDQSAAEIITQRYAFFRSQSQTVITVKGKLNLIFKQLNDRIYLQMDRLFKRFGANSNIKVGLVSGVNKDSNYVTLQINDLGNVFNRVGSVSPDTVLDYASSSEDQIARYGYVVDSDSETVSTDNDNTLGTNLIG